MTAIDICIVAARRPHLLAETLDSFSNRVFANFEIGKVFMNLDPIFGDQRDHLECIELFKRHFPHGIIFQPQDAGFPQAVKRLWSATTAEIVFHLEDDWIALTEIDQKATYPFNDGSVAQVSLLTAEKKWDTKEKGNFHNRNEYVKVLGIKFPLFRKFPIFTTSPCFIRGEFARGAAALMDVTKDPEKQFYYGVNRPLESYVRKFRSYIFAPESKPVIADIGRDWQRTKNIKKIVHDGASSWEMETSG
ncbi:glycosyltransferase family 2 protein [Ensifer canadensis]